MTDTTAPEPLKINFDTEPCGRCGGTGRHSFNQRDGHVCWGCSGNKVRLSRLGRAASDAYEKALGASAGTVAVGDIKPGMRIRSHAHGGLTGNGVPYDLPAAWHTVASVEITEKTREGWGVTPDGFRVDVAAVVAEITFEDGKSWRAETSDDPAYWHKKAGSTAYRTRGFWLGGEEARAARDAVRRDIARRFKGAWLDGEEPPAPAASKPRLRKTADVEAAPKPLPENLYPGDCRHCGSTVAAKEGERLKVDGRWAVQHKAGECPEVKATEEPQAVEEPAEDDGTPRIEERPAMPNRFGGRCADCGAWVEAEQGQRIQREGGWVTLHKDGCAESAPSEERPPVTEPGMYRLGGVIFRVVEGRNSGRLYAKRLTRAEGGKGARFDFAPDVIRRLSAADRMSVEESAEVGREWSVCIVCTAELRKPESIARGMGPTCAENV
ncbi:DUF6011 domain-containing protein [Streptomyces sp. NBC_01242]|uniref:DUF6011 domain-containing protein n=1 Tax=Streptomyces sp. NBC_01242 TaxID=2903795 RepID=UPI0022508C31|nr:DUF6011 domain-containing protein [Streptomyces sp. NBC_01242]MCX4799629.1 DUF6011 domain-containing protein [Streptomyces sp. NBC_01242]